MTVVGFLAGAGVGFLFVKVYGMSSLLESPCLGFGREANNPATPGAGFDFLETGSSSSSESGSGIEGRLILTGWDFFFGGGSPRLDPPTDEDAEDAVLW